ncbi:MAG: hypothetical protein JNJ57_11725 [Saprospiraceae bacterium]|nr:hypothetical protein [Saprospiraceae bacterium]
MKNTQLVELIRLLTAEERRHALDFAKMPFFNHSTRKNHVTPLLEVCLTYDWDNENDLEKEKLHAILYPNLEYNEGRIEKVMVEAHKVIKSFLITQHYHRPENEFQHALDYAEIIRTRDSDDRALHLLSRLQKLQDDYPYKHAWFYLKQSNLDTAFHYIESLYNKNKGDIHIPQVLHSTEMFYLCRKTALLSRLILQQKVTKLEPSNHIREQIESFHIPAYLLEESPPLKLNFIIFLILRHSNPTLQEVEELRDLLNKHEKELDVEVLQEFHAHARNFLILILYHDVNASGVRKLLHELYKDHLGRGWLHYEEKMHPSRYSAVIHNALIIGEFDWANNFIEAYKDVLIGENESHDFYKIQKAVYYFAIGDFNECLDYLPDNSNNITNLLIVKRLELKAYFELKSDLFSFKLDAFKMFLSRTSPKLLPDVDRKMHVHFINFLTRLYNAAPGDTKRGQRILEEIKTQTRCAEWAWLQFKAMQLAGM